MKRYTMMLLPVLLTLAAGCDRSEPGEVEEMETVGTVAVSAAAPVQAGAQIPARVVARETASLATRGSGTVEYVPVDAGSAVRKGQVVVRLESSGVEAAVERAEAQAVVARRSFERLANLERDGAATRQELDQAEAALRTAEAMLDEARAAREYVTLRAPFDGTVSARFVDPGDLAVPGRPVVVISSAGGVKVQADLPASLADVVSEGERVAIVAPDRTGRWAATVRRVVPVIDLASHRFRVEATFDDPSVGLPAAGSFVRLEVAGLGEPGAWIPADAIVRRGQLNGVYVVVDDHLRLRWIRIGRQAADAVEVLAGLEVGTPVVRSPGPGFSDGVAVQAAEAVAWTPTPGSDR